MSQRLAGLGGIAFVVLVIFQNVARGASAPANDASPAELATYFTDHRPLERVLVATFVIGAIGLALFIGGLVARTGVSAWSITGLLGSAGVVALFSLLVATEIALLVAAEGAGAGRDLTILWTLHNAIFGVLTLAVGVALVGLANAASSVGLVPAAFGRLSIAAAALLAVNTVLSPAIAAGSPALMSIGLVGFLGWLVFVGFASVRLTRAT